LCFSKKGIRFYAGPMPSAPLNPPLLRWEGVLVLLLDLKSNLLPRLGYFPNFFFSTVTY